MRPATHLLCLATLTALVVPMLEVAAIAATESETRFLVSARPELGNAAEQPGFFVKLNKLT